MSAQSPLCRAGHRAVVARIRLRSNGDASLGGGSSQKGCSSQAIKRDGVADYLGAFICPGFHEEEQNSQEICLNSRLGHRKSVKIPFWS